MAKSVELDSFDLALLEQVQADNLLPARELAERVGLSESAVLRRLRKLRDDGVITADVSIVSPAAMGVPLAVHVLVTLEREGTAALDAFAQKMRRRSEVRQAWYITGDADFLLHLQLADMPAYEAFSREMFDEDPNVRTFRTMISMREVVSSGDIAQRLAGRKRS
jgi:Lrp/AsnC family transcriptional regulator, leucine-responsive regulatory protein